MMLWLSRLLSPIRPDPTLAFAPGHCPAVSLLAVHFAQKICHWWHQTGVRVDAFAHTGSQKAGLQCSRCSPALHSEQQQQVQMEEHVGQGGNLCPSVIISSTCGSTIDVEMARAVSSPLTRFHFTFACIEDLLVRTLYSCASALTGSHQNFSR